MIGLMQIGVYSQIGSFVIPGIPTAVDNACRLFIQSGVVSEYGSYSEAARFARSFAAGLPDRLNDKMIRSFFSTHERICDGVGEAPAVLRSAFEAFQMEPSSAGMALYFGLLADLLDASKKDRSLPKSS